MSTTSGLGSNYTTNTTSNLSCASSLSSHVNTSSPCRKCESSSEENMHSLPAVYHQQQPQHNYPHTPRMQPVQTMNACESDIYFNNYGMDLQRSAYGGYNTPELTRSPYNSRVPQMGLAATGHRRTLSSNFSGSIYGGTPPPSMAVESQPVLSKNPFLSNIQPPPIVVPVGNRIYENVPFNGFVYSEEGTLRSSLRRKKEQQQHVGGSGGGFIITPSPIEQDRLGDTPKDYSSFSSSSSRVRFSPRSCSPTS